MDQEKKTNKKKILTYYLLLGACILVIAVVTVTVIFTLNTPKTTLTADNSQNVTDDNEGDDNALDTSSTYEFIYPVSQVDVLNSFTFYLNRTLNNYYVHQGMDFSAPAGTSVLACLDGVIESITTGNILDGTTITLTHDNGIKTIYTFVDASPNFQVGDKVYRGEVIGTVAEACGSEYKDGAHLHFEVYVGEKLVDPEYYLDGGTK